MIDTYEPHEVDVIEIAGDEHMGTPQLHVFVHPTRALLNDWRRHEGWKTTGTWPPGEDEPDSMGVSTFDNDREAPFEMHLAADSLYLSIVAHEATHIALWHYWDQVIDGHPGARAIAHIGHHDETMPYAVGNLTALIWYKVLGAGFSPADDADDQLAAGVP